MTAPLDISAGDALQSTPQETIARLMRFYAATTLEELVLAQNSHVEKLQSGQRPSLSDDILRRTPREG